MKTLKSILISLYPALILLLLLNFKGCNNRPSSVREPVEHVDTAAVEEPVSPPAPEEESEDSTLVRRAERTGCSGELKVTLLWEFEGDLDLHVVQPNGREISFKNLRDRWTGGFLDVDNRNGGSGAAENVYWEKARKGKYNVFVNYFGASKDGGVAESGTCTIVVFQQGMEPNTYHFSMTSVKQKKHVTDIVIGS